MTMHLAHPSLSLSGKKKGKVKFRNADEARKARELEESWKALQKQWGVEAEEKRRRRALSAEPWCPTREVYRGDTSHLKSVGQASGVAILAPAKVYTGTKVLGIATLHKSNAVPVFSSEEAVDISKMRR